MRGGVAQRYPQFDDENEQEAARFLATDIDARPVIRGIEDISRLNAWTEVAKELDITGPERRALRQRRQALNNVDEQVEFTPASETDAGEAAVADGGAVVEENSVEEPDDSQDVLEYEDAAERESQYQDAYSVTKMYDDADAVREKLQEEFDRDERRPHVVDALEERLSEVTA